MFPQEEIIFFLAGSGEYAVWRRARKKVEARLNKAIFRILAIKGPLTIYDIYKEVKAQKGLRHTRYASVNKRVRSLGESGYIKKIGIKRTKAGFEASVYELSVRAYLAMLLSQINLDCFIEEAEEEAVLSALTAISSAANLSKPHKNHIWSEQ